MTDFAPQAGTPYRLREDLSLLLAPNPSAMTCLGTNTYIVGEESVMIIDPGPRDMRHLAALQTAIAGRTISHIFVTHGHLDHSPLARDLSQRTSAPIYAFGDSKTGRSPIMQELASAGLTGGGEGIDHDFVPDVILQDGDEITGHWGRFTAIHTPGHLGNHLCFAWKNCVFTGDHVMGWASSLVSPPDGDLTDFMKSCVKLAAHQVDVFYPGHGAPISNPKERLNWLISHRRNREAQILAELSGGQKRAKDITRLLYADVATTLQGAAERNVFAHLVDLHQRGLVSAHPTLSATALFKTK